MDKLKSIFSIENGFLLGIILCLFLVPATVAVGVKTIYGFFNLQGMTSIEGSIKNLSESMIEIEGTNRQFSIKKECACKINSALVSEAKYAYINLIEEDEIVTLKINDITIYDDYKKYKDNISITITFLLILLPIFVALKLINKVINKKAEVNRAALLEIAKVLAPKVNHIRAPALRLHKTTNRTTSKFGGNPTVEKDKFFWPENNGKPMTFLAQFDLTELAAKFNFEWLPKCGVLLFFYDTHKMYWGFETEHKSGWKVIYYENPTATAVVPHNTDKNSIVTETFISFEYTDVLPPWDSEEVESLQLNEDESDAYCELLYDGDSQPSHQIGGYASPIQSNCMQEQAQLTSHGISTGGKYDGKDPKVIELQSGIVGWKLLFQMDSDDDLNVMWGDLGKIYFWVEASKSKDGNFDDSWLILQCT